MKPIPTLYEWMGGEPRFYELINTFYAKIGKDELLKPVFDNLSEEHNRHVSNFIAEVLGGPKKYTGEDRGSHHEMVGHHVGRMLTEKMRKRWVELFLETCDEINIPDDPEFRSSLVGYLEWGSRLAVINSQLNENPLDTHEPMPKWGWGETGGPYMPPGTETAGN